MREGVSKYRALLGVELYEVSTEFMYNLREKHDNPEYVFDILPEYTINNNDSANKSLIEARYYHQFVGTLKPNEYDNQKYLYFNLKTIDSQLNHEISNCGYDDFFNNINFNKILKNFKPEVEDNIGDFVFSKLNYLVVELTYTTSIDYYSGGYESEMDIDIIGYLDNNFNVIKF